MELNFSDTFNKELKADPNPENNPRQVFDSAYSFVTPRKPSDPSLVHVSKEVAQLIGLEVEDPSSKEFLDVFSGARVLEESSPYAMCYGGHQFGNWAGQLGDGRAINLGELQNNNQNWALQLKGSGRTPYSRGADGLAVLRSSVREYLCAEAMHHLGVPTTRSLSLILTGDQVMRDVMYDGNPELEKGAVVCRVAESFIRFGNFEIFASRGDVASLKDLSDYVIKHFFPQIKAGTKQSYIDLFKSVSDLTLEMLIHWQRVGFVHGVMNTDNMSILGLTIDYGPYGWLEGYDHSWTPNTTDRAQRRYRFGNQPQVVLWNLLQLANALVQLVEDPKPFEEVLSKFGPTFEAKHLAMMRSKLGLQNDIETDAELIEDLENVLQLTETDMTIFFRLLADFDGQSNLLDLIGDAFYDRSLVEAELKEAWNKWGNAYAERLSLESLSNTDRAQSMNAVNPKYVLRNYMAQLAIDAADNGDYSIIEELFKLLKQPYDEQPESSKWFAKRPEWARNKVGCSMLSCSS